MVDAESPGSSVALAGVAVRVTDGGGPAAVTVTDTSLVASATPLPRARTVTALLPVVAVGDADKVKVLVVAPALSTAAANVPVTPSGSPSAESVTSAVKAVRTIEISPAATDVPWVMETAGEAAVTAIREVTTGGGVDDFDPPHAVRASSVRLRQRRECGRLIWCWSGGCPGALASVADPSFATARNTRSRVVQRPCVDMRTTGP